MSCLGPVFCHGVRGCQERGDDELLRNTLICTQNIDRWRQVHTPGMTLILDTDAGKHRVLKGETKRGN